MVRCQKSYLFACVSIFVFSSLSRVVNGGEALHDFDAIGIERTSCFGWCPSYSVTIRADGTVEYDGKDDVVAKGARRGVVSKSDIKFLFEAARRMKFQTLQSRYEAVTDGCQEVWTDLPTIIITVNSKSYSKKITYYMGCRGLAVLERLAWFADTVDEVGQVSRWAGLRMNTMTKDKGAVDN